MLESSTPTGTGAAGDASSETAPPETGSAQPGLRERKKQQTRQRIMEVALELCDAQGFEATTVEQIADAADVSPRTINRYFDSKEAIILGPSKDFGITVAETLRGLPITGNELSALREAFLQVVDRAVTNPTGPISFRRFQQMQRIVRSSPTVSAHNMELDDNKNAAIAEVLAERLGTQTDALPVRLVLGAWQLIAHLGMEHSNAVLDDNDTEAAAASARNSFTTSFDEFMRVCAGRQPADTE